MNEFGVSSTAAQLPLVLYVFAMGFGPVVGGPLSETVGRYPVYLSMIPLGALVTVGAGLTHNFGALCFFRFLAGFFWGPALAVVNGSLSETFRPETRGPFMALVLLMPFIGTGFG
jgi:MFS family permease